MIRLALLGLLSLSFACASETEQDAKRPKQRDTTSDPKLPAREPEPVTEERITITAAQAEAAGLPAIGLSLVTTGAGMSGSKLGDGVYLRLSGPPGGPLMLIVSPATVGASLAELIDRDRLGDASLVAEPIELLGASRSAAAWITGESLARTSWCAVILARPAAKPGDPALLLEVGVGHQGDAVSCKTALEDSTIGPVIASLTLE